MPHQKYDALVEIAPSYTRVRTLSPRARDWIESHVTLAQVRTWAKSILEVAPQYLGAIITARLSAHLKLSPIRGCMVESHVRCLEDSFETPLYLN